MPSDYRDDPLRAPLPRYAEAVRRAVVAARRAGDATAASAAVLRAAGGVDWTGSAADGFRLLVRDLVCACGRAGALADDTSADLGALAAAVEQLPLPDLGTP